MTQLYIDIFVLGTSTQISGETVYHRGATQLKLRDSPKPIFVGPPSTKISMCSSLFVKKTHKRTDKMQCTGLAHKIYVIALILQAYISFARILCVIYVLRLRSPHNKKSLCSILCLSPRLFRLRLTKHTHTHARRQIEIVLYV